MREMFEKGAMVVVLGNGGVGKTTIATALALLSSRTDLNTAIVTVDPARRLKDALGLHRLGGTPRRISAARLRQAGLSPSLRLSAMVLDVKGAWDGLIQRFSADPAVTARILDNRFYRALAGQFAGSDSYAALEELYDLHERGSFDLHVVDTPPAAQAMEFVEAPARLIRLLDSEVARWLFTPYAGAAGLAMKVSGRAAGFIVTQLERFAGTNVLSSISDFFVSAAGISGAIAERLRKTQAMMRSPALKFVLVTTAEEDSLNRVDEVIDAMGAAGLSLEAIVINRFLDEHAWKAMAHTRAGDSGALAEIPELCDRLDGQSETDAGLSELAAYLRTYERSVAHAIGRVSRFCAGPGKPKLAVVPNLAMEAGDLRTIRSIAAYLDRDLPDFGSLRPGRAAARNATP